MLHKKERFFFPKNIREKELDFRVFFFFFNLPTISLKKKKKIPTFIFIFDR